MTISNEIKRRIELYQAQRGLTTEQCLGVGTQGSVFVLYNPSLSYRVAVKFHDRGNAYARELSVYLRLRDLDTTHVCGHRVPILLNHDDELLAIEMTVVSPPFVLDFGGAYLDRPPDYSREVWADWRQMKAEAFEENWPSVQNILEEFKSYGIYIADVNPGNIRF